LAEERALDSYYNILFSLVLFWKTHGVWPERLSIVSHAFKKARLVNGHCAAMGFPLDRVAFIGINPPGVGETPASGQGGSGGLTLSEQAASVKAAVMTGVGQTFDDWVKDPHGVGEILAGKRRKRNPWGVDQRLFDDDEERRCSGVQTRLLEDGTEALVDGRTQPWAQ
jgi:folylpolyglutamate synthase